MRTIIGLISFIGWVYWAYIAWTLKSWLLAASLLLAPIASLLGLWSMAFSVPEWVLRLIG